MEQDEAGGGTLSSRLNLAARVFMSSVNESAYGLSTRGFASPGKVVATISIDLSKAILYIRPASSYSGLAFPWCRSIRDDDVDRRVWKLNDDTTRPAAGGTAAGLIC